MRVGFRIGGGSGSSELLLQAGQFVGGQHAFSHALGGRVAGSRRDDVCHAADGNEPNDNDTMPENGFQFFTTSICSADTQEASAMSAA